ncbi:TPA: hypothetical protein ACSP21_002019 [Aeromonas veronii]|nr:hypothetical protein [Aeromonas veronii]
MSDSFIKALYAGDTAANKVMQDNAEINNIISMLEHALSTYLKRNVTLKISPPDNIGLRHFFSAITKSKNDNNDDVGDIFDEVKINEVITELKSESLFLFKKSPNGWPVYIKHNMNTIRTTSSGELELVLGDILKDPSTIFKIRKFGTMLINNENESSQADKS